jgi:hypothetical protein
MIKRIRVWLSAPVGGFLAKIRLDNVPKLMAENA